MKTNARVLLGIVLGALLGTASMLGFEFLADVAGIRNREMLIVFLGFLPCVIAALVSVLCIRGVRPIGFLVLTSVLLAAALGAMLTYTLGSWAGIFPPPWMFLVGPTLAAGMAALAAVRLPDQTKA